MSAGIVIVGAGHAGGAAAAFLKQYGFEGSITLIGDEPLAPYQRPPLSKAWLKGEVDGDSLLLKPLNWYADNRVKLKLQNSVSAISRRDRTVVTASGDVLGYDHLILATGARARPLHVSDDVSARLLSLRTAADAERIKTRLKPGCRLVIIGGGYVGLEVAASARALGAEVVLLEREDRLLARVAGPILASYFHKLHTERGVQIETGAAVSDIALSAEGFSLGLVDGRQMLCDEVLVGIGALPNDQLAKAAGLECQDGVLVDETARTSDLAIFAIGDVSRRPVGLYGGVTRLESVPNALEQARQAAAAIVGRPIPAPEVPWFWSDQFETKLQIAGLTFDIDQTLVRGDVATDHFSVFHLKSGIIQAVEAVNSPADFMGGRQLINSRTRVDPKKLADSNLSIKAVAA